MAGTILKGGNVKSEDFGFITTLSYFKDQTNRLEIIV